MKQKIYILLVLLTMAVGASARGGEGDLYFVELTADSKPEGASFTMTYTEGSNAAQDVSTFLIDEVAPVPAGALVTLAVIPVTGYGVTSAKAETFMDGSEMRARTRGTDAAEDITILGDVEMTKSASNPNTYTFTMPTANVRIALGYKYIVTADMISFGMSGEFTYDKTEKKPDVVVKFNNVDVTEDFTITYANNVKAAAKDAKNAPTVTVTAKATSERFTGSASTTFAISQATLYVKSGITASDKVYDGTATATIDCSKAVLEGLVSGDKVTFTGVTGAFNWVEVYADNYVNLNYENASLSGTDAGNYTLDKVNSQKTATAKVTPAKMTVTAANYSGTYDGQEHSITFTVTGPEDYDVNYGETADDCKYDASAFTYSNVCEKTIYYNVTATNYEPATGSATIRIKPRTVKVVSGITASDKEFDGNADADIDCDGAKLDNIVDGETIYIFGVTGTFADADPGSGKTVNLDYTNALLKWGGNPADNYTLDKVNSQKTATASITSGGDDQPGTTVVKNEDGTTTTTTVTIETNTDGSNIKTITETTTDANGKAVKSIKTIVEENQNGTKTETKTEITRDADGKVVNSVETVVVTYVDGSQTMTETTIEMTRDTYGNVVKSIETVAVTDVDGIQTTTETTTEITRDADGKVVKSVETVVTDDNGIQTTTVTTIETKADGTVRKDVLETFADGTSHESVTETAPDNSMKVTETKTNPDGTTETTEKFVGKPTLGEESNVTDPVSGKTESFSKIEDDGSSILSAITNASLSVATADADNISLVQSSQTVEKNGEVVKSEYSQSLKAKKGSGNIRLVVSASVLKHKTFEKDAMKKGHIICTNKGVVRGFGSQLRKGSLKAHTRADGSDDGMIEIESGVEYEILTDGDLVLTLMTSEGDVEITNINITEPDEPTEYVTVPISSAKQVPYCSDKNLDFTDKPELKAYVATGYDKAKGTIWLTRVKKVPAGTGFLLMGEEGNYEVPVSESASDCYYKNMFKGTLEGTTIQTTDGKYTNYYLSNGTAGVGFYKVTKEDGVKVGANRCYLPILTEIPANGSTGDTELIKVSAAKQVPYYTSKNLDFSSLDAQGVKAYTATGYNYSTGVIWLTRVKKVPAQTGILVMADVEGDYNVPTTTVQSVYENMFVGSETAQTIYTNEKIGDVDYINYYLSKGTAGVGFYKVTNEDGVKMGANRCYLPIPKRDSASGVRGKNAEDSFCKMVLSDESNDDVIAIPLFADDATGIDIQSSIFNLQSNEVYYNLQGQRVEKPRKGIYIHNGRRVVIK